jgi:23S rRNA (cytosine1962-C5)-methyltransferase
MKLILEPKRERSLLRRHPWVFTGAVQTMEGSPQPGETVDIVSSAGSFLARAAYATGPHIRARVWTYADEPVHDAFFQGRIASAIQRRTSQSPAGLPEAARLVFGESDGLPGLTVDKYGAFAVCQFHSAGADRQKGTIVRLLQEALGCKGIIDRSDDGIRAQDGLPPSQGVLAGEPPSEPIEIREAECRYFVDIAHGQKTGFYLDQRLNRSLLAEYAAGRDVLNAFCYTGGFSVNALRGGARHVLNLDSSGPALELARRNMELNGANAGAYENVEGDVFKVLREYRDRARSFDLIVLDPPKFAESLGQLGKASRGYKDINLLAIKLLRPGGVLFTFSCSGAMPEDLFQKIVADAALDARRELWFERKLGQAPDHPVLSGFPEAAYLKGFVCRVA